METTLVSGGGSGKDSRGAGSAGPVEVFISHAHEDKPLAEGLRTLMARGLGMSLEQIRCTGAPGGGYRAGDPLVERVRADLASAAVLVALLTRRSLRSEWVLFECGARWGSGGDNLIPLLGPGAEPWMIPEPISALVAARMETPEQLRKLMSDLGEALGRAVNEQAMREPLEALTACGETYRQSGGFPQPPLALLRAPKVQKELVQMLKLGTMMMSGNARGKAGGNVSGFLHVGEAEPGSADIETLVYVAHYSGVDRDDTHDISIPQSGWYFNVQAFCRHRCVAGDIQWAAQPRDDPKVRLIRQWLRGVIAIPVDVSPALQGTLTFDSEARAEGMGWLVRGRVPKAAERRMVELAGLTKALYAHAFDATLPPAVARPSS